MKRDPARIVVSGYYGFGNAGDEAILAATLAALRKLRVKTEVTVISGDPSSTSVAHGVDSIPRSSPVRILRALRRADLLLSGGGGLFQDVTSFRSLAYYLSIVSASRALRVPVMVYGQGFGPLRRPISRFLARRILNGIACIAVRDEASAAEMKKLGIRANDFRVTADPVMLLEREANPSRIALRHGLGPGTYAIASIRPWRGMDVILPRIAQSMNLISSRHGVEFLLVPMQKSQDLPILERLRGITDRSRVVADCSAFDILELAEGARFVVGMRLHSLMFALKALTPFLALPYDPKVTSFALSVDAPCIDMLSEEALADGGAKAAEELAGAMEDLLRGAEPAKAALKMHRDALERSAAENVSLIQKLLEARDYPPGK